MMNGQSGKTETSAETGETITFRTRPIWQNYAFPNEEVRYIRECNITVVGDKDDPAPECVNDIFGGASKWKPMGDSTEGVAKNGEERDLKDVHTPTDWAATDTVRYKDQDGNIVENGDDIELARDHDGADWTSWEPEILTISPEDGEIVQTRKIEWIADTFTPREETWV